MNKAMILKEPKLQEKLWGTGEVRTTDVYLTDSDGNKTDTIKTGNGIIVTISYFALKKVYSPDFRVEIYTTDGICLISVSSWYREVYIEFFEGNGTIQCHFESLPLIQNAYIIGVYVGSVDNQIDYDMWLDVARFTVTVQQKNGNQFLPAYNGLISWPAKLIHEQNNKKVI